MWSAVRTELFGKQELDIDIENCHPTILLYLCEKYGIDDCAQLSDYVTNRNKYVRESPVTEEDVRFYNEKTFSNWTKKDFVKFAVTCTMYGSSEATIQSTLHMGKRSPLGKLGKKLVKEIREIADVLVGHADFSTMIENIRIQNLTEKGKKCHTGTFLSFILQEEETRVVQKAMETFLEAGYEVTSYIYDGFQLREGEEAREDVERNLNILNEGLAEDDLYPPVKFLIKDWRTPLSALEFIQTVEETEVKEKEKEGIYSDLEGARLLHRKYFGKTVFRISSGDNPVFVTVRDGFCSEDNGTLNCLIMEEDIRFGAEGNLFSVNVSCARRLFQAFCALTATEVTTGLFKEVNNSTIGLIFYQDGIYDMMSRTFTPGFGDRRTFVRLKRNFPTEIYSWDHPHVKEIMRRVLKPIFGTDETVDYACSLYARALTGNYTDKYGFFEEGERDSGKGVITECHKRAFENYVTSFDMPIASGSSTDVAKSRSWMLSVGMHRARIAISNES
jgi:hypothetical protein